MTMEQLIGKLQDADEGVRTAVAAGALDEVAALPRGAAGSGRTSGSGCGS